MIVCDATFYGKRKDKLGTLVFKDITQNEILVWKHIDRELVFDYKQQLKVLLDLGYDTKAIIIDGKRGLYRTFKGYPIQNVSLSSKKDNKQISDKKTKIRS